MSVALFAPLTGPSISIQPVVTAKNLALVPDFFIPVALVYRFVGFKQGKAVT